MVQSVNIEKTNQYVWNLIKTTLREIRDQSPRHTDHQRQGDHDNYDRHGLLSDEISWITEQQVDLLNDDDKKTFISKMISSSTVHFDEKTKKHTFLSHSLRQCKESSTHSGKQGVLQ